MEVAIREKSLQHPVCVASGTFGYGSEFEDLIDLGKIGALFSKSVTIEERAGNDIPRLVETPSGLLNSIGLANVGIERYVDEKLPLFASYPCPVVANIAGGTLREFEQLTERLSDKDAVWGFEINLSCPNVEHGLAFGTEPATVEALVHRLRNYSTKPLIVKLTPNVTDITEIAAAAENGGADAVSCINTLIGMVIDTEKRRPVLPAGTGGLSGPAIRAVGVAAVYRVARRVSIPVFGIGGIMCATDAIQYLLAGASAVQIGTGNFVDPSIVAETCTGIDAYAEKAGFSKVDDFHNFID